MLSGDTEPRIMLILISSWLCSLATIAVFSFSCMGTRIATIVAVMSCLQDFVSPQCSRAHPELWPCELKSFQHNLQLMKASGIFGTDTYPSFRAHP